MTRRSEASGPTLQAALTEAVAGVLGCEPEKVELELRAPGVDDVEGRATVIVQIEAVDPEEPEGPEGPDAEDGEGTEEAPVATDDRTSDDAGAAAASGDDQISVEDLDEEADAAADFLEGLLDAMDLPGDLRLRVHDDHAEIEVVEIGSGALIGRRGQTLEAIQELLRCALQREFQRRARVKVDAEGYRARRLEKLIEKAEEAIDDVLDTGEPQRLEPMDVFERKAIHHLVAEVEGLSSRSQGREPARRVIIERE